MEGLGWRIAKEECDLPIRLPKLSGEEEEVVLKVSRQYSEWSKSNECGGRAEAQSAINAILSEVLDSEGLEADDSQREYLCGAALSHLWGLSILDSLLSDDSIEEIACIGINLPLYAYLRGKGWKKTNGYFTSPDHLVHVANKIARPLGRRLSAQTPRLNAVLPDGSRLHASIPPISHGELTIRKFTAKPLGIGDLMRLSSCPPKAFAFLWLAMQSDSSAMVAGNTSSGKTTLLGAMLSFIPLNERILLIEETPELRPLHPHKASLLSNDELGIAMGDLVRDSLRMRPDRVIVGEVRTRQETSAWMESVLSGQARGAYATFHAQSGPEALRRLKSLGVDEIDLPSLDYIIVCRRMARYDAKRRKLDEIRRVTGIFASDKQSPRAIPLFEYDFKKGELRQTAQLKSHSKSLCARLGMDSGDFNSEMKRREKFLTHLANGKADFAEECRKIQEFAYG